MVLLVATGLIVACGGSGSDPVARTTEADSEATTERALPSSVDTPATVATTDTAGIAAAPAHTIGRVIEAPPPVDESEPRMQADGPLRGLALIDHIPLPGSDLGVRLAFTTSATEAVAVVALANDVTPGSVVAVAWYRLAGAGRELLFAHEIEVGPGGIAYSAALAAGGFAPGVYESVAHLGDHQVRTPWVVHTPSPNGFRAPSAGSAPMSDHDWDDPVPGESGWDPGHGDRPPPPDSDACAVDSILASLSPYAGLRVSAFFLRPCRRATLSATVAGPPLVIAEGGGRLFRTNLTLYGQADACELSGGSDMPGTEIRLEVTGDATASKVYVLPDHGETLATGAESLPAAGSRVAAGDTIRIEAFAIMFGPALGIESLTITANGREIDSVGNGSGSSEPTPCDELRYLAALGVDYRVPPDPNPEIRICSAAVGFDGTTAPEYCIVFHTTETWYGTYAGTVTYACVPTPLQGTLAGTYTVTVAPDGTATLVGENTVVGSCAGPDVGSATTPISVTGERTTTGFRFPSLFGGGGTVVIPVTDGRGSAAFSDAVPGQVSVDLVFELDEQQR